MGKVDVIQTSFGGGEVAPALFGRTDIDQYSVACQIVENFLVKTSGALISTPGTTYVRTVSNVTLRTRLIKFVFNRSDAYIIEMGKNYFRFYTNQGIVLTTGTTPYVLAHIYSDTEVFDVKYTQINDTMYFAHPDYPPQEMRRISAASWTISGLAFIGGPFLDNYVAPSAAPTLITAATIKISSSSIEIGDTTNITATTNALLFTLSAGTLGHKNTYWKIGGLANTSPTTLLQEEGYVQLTTIVNTYTATGTTIKKIRNNNAVTLYAEGAWSSVRGYPASVCLHDGRLFFGRTDAEPQKIWGSRTFQYTDYALDTQAEDDGLNLGLASNESNEILWIASVKSLIVGTFGGAFVVSSGSSAAITPDNVQAQEQSGFGASSVQPKRIGNLLLYVQRFGKKLREMLFDFDTDTYQAADRTILSPHILGDGVIDMDVVQNPEPILYCVLTSGTLATLTREVDQEMSAWSRQSTSGTYVSVAVIPSQTGLYDEVWVIVQRWINGAEKRYVELFSSPEVPAQQFDCIYLHSALTYDAYDSSSTSAVSISLSASSGSVTLTSSGAYFNGQMATSSRRIRVIDAARNTIGEGVITATSATTSITLSITTTFSALTYAAGLWGVSVGTVGGLDHLDTETVGILADGLTESLTKTVASNSVTLGTNYFVIHVGLSYDQIVQTLPKEAGNERGTAQGKFQRFNEIYFKLNRSTQDFKYGPDASNLDNVNVAFTPSVTTLYTGILPPKGGGIGMRGGYVRGAQIYIKNSNPLPIELLSMVGTLDTQEK